MPKLKLQKEEILKTLTYNPETGEIIRILRRNRWGFFPVKEISGTSNHGYIQTGVLGKHFFNHRIAWFIMTGDFPAKGIDIDHINGKRDDNRWSNLRLATRGQNNMNSDKPRNNTTGQKGVHKNRDNGWFSRIKFNGKVIHLGCYDKIEDAISARKAAEVKYFGDFKR